MNKFFSVEVKKLIIVFGIIIFLSNIIFFLSEAKEKESRKETEIVIRHGEVITLAERKEKYKKSKKKGKEKIRNVKGEDILVREDLVRSKGTEIGLSAEHIGWVKIYAERSIYNMRKNTIELFGGVKIKSDKFSGELKRAKIKLDEKGKRIRFIEGSGDVFIIYGDKKVKAKEVNIIPYKKVVIFKGNPEIESGNLRAKGELIKIFLDSDEVEIKELSAELEERKNNTKKENQRKEE